MGDKIIVEKRMDEMRREVLREEQRSK